jgi:exosortase
LQFRATNRVTDMIDFRTALAKRWILFCCWIALSVLLLKNPIVALVRMSLSHDNASHLVLIPFISVWVLYIQRNKVFLHISSARVLGSTLLFLSICDVFALLSAKSTSSRSMQLSGWILALLLVWVAGFALLFGKPALKAGSFPLLFLSLMVPLPDFLLDRVILFLQEGSAWITGALFDLLGVPALRDGLVFHLARVNIEVTQECSGIRSSMALLILALLISHFRLKNFWNKLLFIACGLFMMIIKNGIRIATLTLLAVYVDPSFLFGRLHQGGGIVFFALALLLLLPLLLFLQRSETHRLGTAERS